MDFKEEQDEIFEQIANIRTGFRTKDTASSKDINNKLAILTGTSLWIYSNCSEINSAEDFREKIDSFQKVLNNQLYLSMERNLCVAAGIMGYLNGERREDGFKKFASVAGVSSELSGDELRGIVRERYKEAAGYFQKINENEEIKKVADSCHFAMNFKFDEDYSRVETTYSAVGVFRDVAAELEKIYEKKTVTNQIDNVKSGVKHM